MRRLLTWLLLAAFLALPATQATATLLHPFQPPKLKKMVKPPLIKPKPPGEKHGLLHKHCP